MKKMTLVKLLLLAGLAVMYAFGAPPVGCCHCPGDPVAGCPNPGNCIQMSCGTCCSI